MSAPRWLRSPWPWRVPALGLFMGASLLPLLPCIAPLFSLEGWAGILDPRRASLLLETAGLACSTAGLAMAWGLPTAILASRILIPGRRILALLLPLPLLLPPLLLAQAWHGMTGMDGRWATVFVLGLAFAPLPALLACRALRGQSATSHEAALLSGGPPGALLEMFRIASPATFLGGALAFLLAAGDFAVPDYFGTVGPGFGVYAAEIFNAWRDWNTQGSPLNAGLAAAAPLIFLTGVVLYLALRNPLGQGVEGEGSRRPTLLQPGRASAPLALLGLFLGSVLILLPLGRVFWETGIAGPLADGTWISRSLGAFFQAFERGRTDLLRSLFTGCMAGVLVLGLAPFLAHLVPRGRPGRVTRAVMAVAALPLLVPGVATGLGAVQIFHRPGWEAFYEGPLLPALVLGGRFLPLAVFLIAERMARTPRANEEAGMLAGLSYPARIYHGSLGSEKGALLLAAGLVAVFSFRELDLAVLLPAANASAAVRYYNALHFARDSFVAALGILMAFLLFLPVALFQASALFSRRKRT